MSNSDGKPKDHFSHDAALKSFIWHLYSVFCLFCNLTFMKILNVIYKCPTYLTKDINEQNIYVNDQQAKFFIVNFHAKQKRI